MDIIISHNSALEYWRLHRNAKIDDTAKLRRKSLPAGIPNTSEVHERIPQGVSFPVNLIAVNPDARRQSKAVRTRVYTGSVPEWCFIRIGDGIFVSAPQFCFFQMAGELPLVKLIELGLEFCGTYTLPVLSKFSDGSDDEYGHGRTKEKSHQHESESGNAPINHYINEYGNICNIKCLGKSGGADSPERLYNHPQLASAKALNAFISHMEGVGGQKKAHRALRYLADDSASPMETIVFMLLTLPYKLGGYGLPKPKLNKRIDTKRIREQKSGRAFYKCDFIWPEASLAVEYDSDLHHTGPEHTHGDSIKRLELKALGIEVVTVTSGQVRSVSEFDSVAKTIAKKLGKRLWYKDSEFQGARKGLRDLLLGKAFN